MAINKVGRSELDFEWLARYEDGSVLKQYDDEKDEEHHFGHIDQERLREFVLFSRRGPSKTVSVNLRNGLFFLNGKVLEELEVNGHKIPLGHMFLGKKISKRKLIYFRRVRRDFDMDAGTMTATISYILGYDVVADGKKIKEILQVNPGGTITIYEDPEKEEGFTRL